MTFDDFRRLIRRAITNQGYSALLLHQDLAEMIRVWPDGDGPPFSDDEIDLSELAISWREVPELTGLPDLMAAALVSTTQLRRHTIIYLIVVLRDGLVRMRGMVQHALGDGRFTYEPQLSETVNADRLIAFFRKCRNEQRVGFRFDERDVCPVLCACKEE